jgi:hypothetical protein
MSRFVHGWPNTRNIWIARIILVVVLLAVVIGLSYLHINGTYKPIMNCRGVVVRGLKAPGWVCDGFSVLGFRIPGPASGINGPLEWLRKVTVWTILAFFVIASLIATILYNIIVKPIIRLIRRDPEEWRKFLENLRTWCLILAVFLLLFLISVYKADGLALPPFLQNLLR